MADEIVGYRPYPMHFDKWKLDAIIVKTDDGRIYFAVRPLCIGLGVSVQSQLDMLHAEDVYEGALDDFRIPTPGGMQPMVCVRKKECAWWLSHISPKRVKAEVRQHLEEIRADLMAEADRLVFGDLSAVLRDAQIQPYQPIRGELSFGCPRCGAPLCFVVADSGVHLRVG